MDSDDPWAGILAATMFAVRATYHTTLQASPMQLVFGRDAILNVKHITDWEHIKQRKQTRINENNARKTKSRRVHQEETKPLQELYCYLLNSIARQTSLEIREFTLPGSGPC
jgi:hypothetical protein